MTRRIWIDDEEYVPCMDCSGDKCADPQYVCVKPKKSRSQYIRRKIWKSASESGCDIVSAVLFGFFSFVTMLMFVGSGLLFATGETTSGLLQFGMGVVYMGLTLLAFHILVDE